jgi:hypothetical protein
MEVYKITNIVNGKIYVGQTKNNFSRRYDSKENWWKSSKINDYLKNSIKKYGPENFSIEILQDGIESLEKLDEIEIEYIKKFNSLFPNGYNYSTGGQKRRFLTSDKEFRVKLSLSRRKKASQSNFVLKNNKTGIIHSINNMAEFCREQGISDSLISAVLYGRRKKHKEWSLPETKLKHWVLRAPNGEIFDILEGEYRPFCKSKEINRRALLQGMPKGTGHKKWVLVKIYEA